MKINTIYKGGYFIVRLGSIQRKVRVDWIRRFRDTKYNKDVIVYDVTDIETNERICVRSNGRFKREIPSPLILSIKDPPYPLSFSTNRKLVINKCRTTV